MTNGARVKAEVSWAIVIAIIVGCVVVGLGIVLGVWWLATIGAVVIVGGLAGALALPGRGLSGPISLSAQYPSRTFGWRGGDGDHVPPIDTQPGAAVAARNRAAAPDPMPEVIAGEAPVLDTERVMPMHVNLGPAERLRKVGGVEFIEMPAPEEGEDEG